MCEGMLDVSQYVASTSLMLRYNKSAVAVGLTVRLLIATRYRKVNGTLLSGAVPCVVQFLGSKNRGCHAMIRLVFWSIRLSNDSLENIPRPKGEVYGIVF